MKKPKTEVTPKTQSIDLLNLDSGQVREMVELIKEIIGPNAEEMLSDFGRKTEDVVRFLGFSTLCKRTREERGLTIKDVSRELKVPQYRLKAIEEKMVEQILPDVLNQYVDFLGLQECFEKWAENNPAVYQKIVDKQK